MRFDIFFCVEHTIPTAIRSTIVQREHEHSRSLEQSSPPINSSSLSSTNPTVDKQSRSFDAVHLLRPGSLRPDTAANRRTKSYENADDRRSSIAPPPIVIKIPDMSELVQAAQLSQLKNRRDSGNLVKREMKIFIFNRFSFLRRIIN